MIKIENNRIDARELHKVLEVGRDFPTWITDRIKTFGYTEPEDFTGYQVERSAGTPAKEYWLTLPMAAELALLQKNDKGRAIRRFLLDQKPVQKCACDGENCTDTKPIWELTLDDLKPEAPAIADAQPACDCGGLKACRKCLAPFIGEGTVCPGCSQREKNQVDKATLRQQRNACTVTGNVMVQCLIEREGDTTTAAGSFGTLYTFRRNQYGHAVAKVDNPLHREQLLKSHFYRSYTAPQEAA